MNNTIIQENSGLSSFYSKVYGFVGMGIAISALVSGLMLTTFQTALVEILLHYSWIYYGAIFIELAWFGQLPAEASAIVQLLFPSF